VIQDQVRYPVHGGEYACFPDKGSGAPKQKKRQKKKRLVERKDNTQYDHYQNKDHRLPFQIPARPSRKAETYGLEARSKKEMK